MGYVPTRHYAEGPEIFAHCQAIARRYDLYELAVFQTTVTSTVWDEPTSSCGASTTDRGDRMTAHVRDLRQRHAVQAEAGRRSTAWRRFDGHSFHTSRWDYDYTGPGPRAPRTTRSSASSAPAPPPCRSIPNLGAAAKELYVFQRTPSSIDIRDDWATDPEWAAKLQAGLAGEAAGEGHAPSRR